MFLTAEVRHAPRCEAGAVLGIDLKLEQRLRKRAPRISNGVSHMGMSRGAVFFDEM
jgi:hypothetical protein